MKPTRTKSDGSDGPPPEGRGPGRPPGGGDSRQLILDAAAKIFLRDGLSASTRDIAAEAGVTPAAIYHYFPGKRDLIHEAAAAASQLFEPIGAQAVADGEPEEILRRLAERYLATFARPEMARFMATMLSAGMKMPGFLPMMAGRIQKGVVGPTITYLETLQKEGRIGQEIDPPMVGQMLFGSCFSYMMARYVLKAPWVQDIEPEALARQLAHVLVNGMGGAAAPAAGADDADRKGGPDEVA
ncbi:MAG: TetR/AcrR family transcriptional regulator [Actinobacteria bacterium]|nr:TetR/AcrR family transcriptional regulator [Actinomycetota bacterium]